ncbi:hypothetical protein K439DRAFT_1021994 [Ramaria rubella]|nr:hypothetical protein K439DRAFT_1021994 [Ramaria rubella]
MNLTFEVPIIVPWLVLDATGQWCLLVLLVTYASGRHLRQRNNAYLVNLILTSFLTTIPAMLYSGHQFSSYVPKDLCLAQAVLMDGVAPMFSVAQLMLVFDTWCRASIPHSRHFPRNAIFLKLLIAPYFAFGFWTFASYAAAWGDPVVNMNNTGPLTFVYCRNSGSQSSLMRELVGIFIVVIAFFEVILELWVAWMIYAYPSKVQDDPTAWRTNIQFSLRILLLSFVQFLTIILSFVDLKTHNGAQKLAYELLDSMAALATFCIIGTQTTILLTWRSWLLVAWNFITRKKPEEPEGLQPQGLPTLDWAYVPRKNFDYGFPDPRDSVGSDIGNEEKGLLPINGRRLRAFWLFGKR